jgi:hypothetical protein
MGFPSKVFNEATEDVIPLTNRTKQNNWAIWFRDCLAASKTIKFHYIFEG